MVNSVKGYFEWWGSDGIAIALLFGTFAGVMTDSLWKAVIVGLLASVVGYWIVLGMEKHDKKLLEPYQKQFEPIFADYQKLRAFVSEIVNRRVPNDFKGPQTIVLTEKEIADMRDALKESE